MYPYIHILGRDISSYGIMVILGFIFAIVFATFRAKRFGYDRQDIFLVSCIALAGGVAGMVLFKPIIRLPYVMYNWDKISLATVGDFFRWYFSELVFYGGLIGGALAVILYCRKFRMPHMVIGDVFAPAIPIGHAIGRIGCLLGGCCYGTEVDPSHPFAVIYPGRFDGITNAAPSGVPLLAVPVIESCVNLVIALIIVLFERKNSRLGRGILLYGLLYGTHRFVLEFFRGDLVRGVYGWISTAQVVSILIFVPCLIIFIYMSRRSRESNGTLTNG